MNFIRAIAVLLVVLVSGCSPEHTHVKPPIRITYPDWAEGEAMSFLAESFLEQMGYRSELQSAPVETIYRSLYFGKQDVFLDAWLPDTHEFYYKMYEDRLEILSTVIGEARIGLVVPSYVAIDSIEDLHSTAEIFNGRIIGIDKGAGIMLKTEQAMRAYDLFEYQLVCSSERNMTAILSFAIKTRRPILITGWDYHWKFTRFDLKFLDDPKGIYSKTDKIQIIARKGFSKEYPEATKLLENFKITREQFKTLLSIYRLMNTETEKKATVAKWLQQHPEISRRWLTGDDTVN